MMVNMTERFQNAIEKTKILNDTAVEYINGIEVIKAFGKAKSSYERFVVAAKEGSDCFVEWMRDCIWPFTIAFVIAPSTLLSVLPIGGFLFLRGSLSAVDFISVIILSMSVIQPLLTVYSYHDDIAKATVIFGEVGAIMDMKELERPSADKKKPVDNSIELRDVRFSYHKEGRGGEVIHGVSLKIPQGSCTAFVGPSGSGKSTLARLIASLWDVDSGSVEIGGVNIKDLSLEEYNRRVAYVSQDNFLFDMSVRDNIRLGRPDASDKEVETMAKKSGCHDFIMSLENGYDTIVGGQESVARLVKGKTLIVIAHRLSTIRDADMIYVIKDGAIDSCGTHEQLLKKRGLYKSMWEAHISAKDE